MEQHGLLRPLPGRDVQVPGALLRDGNVRRRPVEQRGDDVAVHMRRRHRRPHGLDPGPRVFISLGRASTEAAATRASGAGVSLRDGEMLGSPSYAPGSLVTWRGTLASSTGIRSRRRSASPPRGPRSSVARRAPTRSRSRWHSATTSREPRFVQAAGGHPPRDRARAEVRHRDDRSGLDDGAHPSTRPSTDRPAGAHRRGSGRERDLGHACAEAPSLRGSPKGPLEPGPAPGSKRAGSIRLQVPGNERRRAPTNRVEQRAPATNEPGSTSSARRT